MDLGEHVVRTLLYFDIFRYPLRSSEVFKFLKLKLDCQSEVTDCLNDLAKRKHIFRFGDLYSVNPGEQNIHRRIKGNQEAQKWLPVAKKKAAFIGKFPYVRAVMASGSLSKGYMDESSDLDFFIVTAPNRLWVARTLLVLYKRIFLLNSHKQFCVNYFVDAEHLEIEEKNLFTATELITLVPLYDQRCYEALLQSNTWVTGFFPNFKCLPPCEANASRPNFIKDLFEVVMNPVSQALDKFLMEISLRRWSKIYGDHYSKEDFDIAFKTRRHVSKNHPNNYQKKIMDRYHRKVVEFENRLRHPTTYE